MIIKIKRQDALDQFTKFPQADHMKEEYFYPKVYKRHELFVAAESVKGISRELSIEIPQLMKHLGISSLIFLGDIKYGWYPYYKQHDHKLVKEAVQFLKENKVGPRFNGALQVDFKDLKEFIRHLYPLTLTNALSPMLYFMDKEQNILGIIHYRGMVFISAFNKKYNKLLIESVYKTNFKFEKPAK
jgi:hypothetical protein